MLAVTGLVSGGGGSAAPPTHRGQLISRILELNPTATGEFLSGFSDAALADYLDHLQLAHEPRDQRRGWVRREGVPAIVSRQSS